MATLICGVDGHPGAAAALSLCQAIRAEGDEVHAIHVVPDRGRVVHLPWADRAPALARARAAGEELLEGVDADVCDVVIARSRGRGLHDAAAERGAAILAVGATHAGRFARLLPGSVLHELLHGAPCPVLVVPAGAEIPTHVTVAYDGGPEADVALAAGTEAARRLGAPLRILGVSEPLPSDAWAAMPVDFEQQMHDLVVRRTEQARERVSADEAAVRSGPAGRTIVEAAAAPGELIVMGSRGFGPTVGVMLGSTARHVADHARVPVMLTPRHRVPVRADPVQHAMRLTPHRVSGA